MEIFSALESEVRSYCRSFPTIFDRAQGARLWDETGREFIDFWAGAGTVSYGHNNPRLKARLLAYLERDGIVHGLDLATTAKREFLLCLHDLVLIPRGLSYKVQFPGPTGTNAIEAALKLARKVTRRQTVVYFSNAYHGMTLGALAVTGNSAKRAGAGVPLLFTYPIPYDGDLGPGEDGLDLLAALLENPGSGLDLPAAVVVETIQAEGGVKVARFEWLTRLAALLERHGVLLIVDDIQVGCGRTGPFFSFEPAGLHPDIIVLSKAIGGFGLPLSIILLKPELDRWKPGEHNGTFRGNNLAFVTAAEALLAYWQDDSLSREVEAKGKRVSDRLAEMVRRFPESQPQIRGRGLIQGLTFADRGLAQRISRQAFERGLLVETAGPYDEVLKLLPPLVIEPSLLETGLQILAESVESVLAATPSPVLEMTGH